MLGFEEYFEFVLGVMLLEGVAPDGEEVADAATGTGIEKPFAAVTEFKIALTLF